MGGGWVEVVEGIEVMEKNKFNVKIIINKVSHERKKKYAILRLSDNRIY